MDVDVSRRTDRLHSSPAWRFHWRSEALPKLAFAAFPLLFLLPINHDAVWQMWIGRQLLHGAELYSDIIEVNPPLWFWLAVPLAWIAETFSLPETGVLVAFFIVAIGLSFYLVTRFDRRPIFLAAFLIAVLPLGAFGQREHFTLIVAVPYVLLVGARRRGEPVSTRLSVVIGLFAAAGFALKPHFALVPIALELWLWRKPFRPETIALGIVAAAYGAAILLFAPAYLTDTIPLVRRAYHHFSVMAPHSLMALVPFLLAAPLLRNSAFLVAGLAFALAMILQGKLLGYHPIPAHGSLLLAIASAQFGKSLWRDSLAVAGALLILIPRAHIYRNDVQLDIPEGKSVAVLSYSTLPAWPMAAERKWPLRYMALWSLPAAVETGDAELLARLRREVRHDLACNPPDMVVTDQRSIDVAALFPLPNYRLVSERGGFAYYRLAAVPARPSGCRTIV
jgi:hypothetical protein